MAKLTIEELNETTDAIAKKVIERRPDIIFNQDAFVNLVQTLLAEELFNRGYSINDLPVEDMKKYNEEVAEELDTEEEVAEELDTEDV